MSDFWNALSALGTCSAVIISLWIAQRDKKRIRKLEIYQEFVQSFDDGIIKLIITIENIGNTPIIINQYGRMWKNKNTIMMDINKFLVTPYEPILIKANEAKVIEYVYCFNRSFEEGDCNIENSQEFKLLSKATFKAKDTLGNQYYQKI